MKSVYEFFDAVSKLKKKEEKVNALRNNDTFPIRTVLQAVYDQRIKFILPDGIPPYKPNELVDQENVFVKECRKLVYFIEGPYPGLNSNKREMMFIELLESVDKKDAQLLVSIKDKVLPFKGITEDIVREAFPNLLPQESKK